MTLPFSTAQFFAVFAAYNSAIWPAPVLAYAAALPAVALLFRPRLAADRVISLVLAAMWGFAGIVYHGIFFYPINSAALLFGLAFVAQGAIFFVLGVMRRQLHFGWSRTWRSGVGAGLIFYSMVVYPAAGLVLGHPFPNLPLFGVAPCPILIFTFGLLLMLRGPVASWVIVIPVLWSIVGGSAAILLNVPQDLMLPVGGALTVGLLVKAQPRLLRWP